MIVHGSLGLDHRRVVVGTVVEVNIRKEKVGFATKGYSLTFVVGCCCW